MRDLEGSNLRSCPVSRVTINRGGLQKYHPNEVTKHDGSCIESPSMIRPRDRMRTSMAQSVWLFERSGLPVRTYV